MATVLRRLVRASRRLEYVAEFGVEEGMSVPLTLNLMAIVRAPDASSDSVPSTAVLP